MAYERESKRSCLSLRVMSFGRGFAALPAESITSLQYAVGTHC